MRMCVACRVMQPKKTLIRIVRSPEDGVCVDLTGKKSGKGAYLCRKAECIEKARKTSALKRALDADIPQDIYKELSDNAQ
ncbi:MAG: YlxR family protein [Clostridia bacterium]|nr:YlxR family protein [Clostridia bacterium]